MNRADRRRQRSPRFRRKLAASCLVFPHRRARTGKGQPTPLQRGKAWRLMPTSRADVAVLAKEAERSEQEDEEEST